MKPLLTMDPGLKLPADTTRVATMPLHWPKMGKRAGPGQAHNVHPCGESPWI